MHRTASLSPQPGHQVPPGSSRNKLILFLGVAIALVSIAVAVGLILVRGPHHSSAPTATTTVLTVNGTTVPFEELDLFLHQDRANVYSQRASTAESDRDFWTTPVHGVTPSQTLLDDAVQDSATQTVQFQLAHRYGLLSSPTFSYFLQTLAAENNRRSQALSEGKPIYGPQQYSESNYLTYLTGDLAQELQDKMIADGTIAVTDSEVRAYFDSHRAEYEPTSGTGPVPDTFSHSRKAIRQIVGQQQYALYVSRQTAAATSIRSTALATILPSGCIANGRC